MDSVSRKPDESFDDYLVRLFSNRDNYNLNNREVTELLNKDSGSETVASTYRRDWQAYQRWKKYFDAHNTIDGDVHDAVEDEQLRQSIIEERTKLRDERNELNRLLREKARSDDFWEMLGKRLSENGEHDFPEVPVTFKSAGNGTMLVCLSDIHYGLTFDNDYGKYNSEICCHYFANYAAKVKRIAEANECHKCVIALMGDLINGNIHITARISNRESLIEQVKGVSENIAAFVYSLLPMFDSIDIISVAGNHSRVGEKDDALNEERLDNIVPWYLDMVFRHNERVSVADSRDSTFTKLDIEGHAFWFMHGDLDDCSEKAVYRLSAMKNCAPPYAAVFGHMHQTKFIGNNINLLQSGCFAGKGDQHAVSRRLGGKPSQLVTLIDKDGISAIYPIMLNN